MLTPVRAWLWFAVAGLLTAAAQTLPPPGFRPLPPGTHALVGARVFTQPDTSFSNATVVIRDGRIAAVGPEVSPPADARIWNLSGRIIYAGLIDPYLALSSTNRPIHLSGDRRAATTHGGANARAADTSAGGYRFYGVSGQESDAGADGPGYALSSVTPQRRVAESYSPDTKQLEALRDLGFTAGNVIPSSGIIRGQSAFVMLGHGSPNEALLSPDSRFGTAQHIAFEVPGGDDAFPNSLMGTIAAIRQAFFDAQWWSASQAATLRDPLRSPRTPANEALQALQAPLDRQPVFFEPGSILMVDRARQLAAELGIRTTVMVASGDEWRRPDLIRGDRTAYIVPLGFPALPKLPSEDSWESVTLDALRSWDWAPENPALLHRSGAPLALTTFGLGDRKEFRKNLRTALDRGLPETDALAALTTLPAKFCGVEDLLGTITPGKLANLTICDSKGYFDVEGKVISVWIDGRPYEVTPADEEKPADLEKSKSADDAQAKAKEKEKEKEKEKDKKKERELRDLARKRLARDPLAGRGVLTNPPSLLIRGATVWTCGPNGILTNANLRVEGGRIVAVGSGAMDPGPDTLVIDGTGLHLTPGLIDCHSHSAILGAVNESGLPSTSMVRIGDVVNSETPNLHRQLAGGLTIANLLHGSANPIGGQNQVIKLREGASPEDLKYTNAPSGIKFALGENVKQSNWGDKFTTRFPQTRMGVPTFHQNRFTAAQQYTAAWKTWEETKGREPRPPPPRRDLELEAIAEIIAGTRLIHCHSYRQDEIIAFLRVMETFGVRVATLQHVLEGYKVADEIARHGAGGSAFADWWAYKFEVYDAIPYGGSLMRDRGVTVSFNSDDDDLARRLNFEAAKAVKYGGTSEAEALKFVTLNPAKQLGIDRWVGSLEPGKDADLVLWSGSPLDSQSQCVQTWIEGRKYFDRQAEPARVQGLSDERTALIAKAKKLAGEGADATASEAARDKFFRRALESARHLGVAQCQDCVLPRRE